MEGNTVSAVSPRGETANNIPTDRELIGDTCPACESTEAWHPCITEDGSTKSACDECGASMAILRPAPKPKPKHRRFEFVAEIKNGNVYVDINDCTLFAFERGKGLEIGPFAFTTTHAIADAEDAEFSRGFEGGRENAKREAEAVAS